MSRPRLPPAVVALGLTSLFTDASSEMIVPLLPLFLASMQASATMLGLVEGAAEATASLLKLGSGWLADRLPRKKPLVVGGYLLAAMTRPSMAVAALPAHVLAIRVVDRIGKGIRTSPRDAILAASAPPDGVGRAFGFHRAMDHAGAVIGPLIAAGLLALGWSLRAVFWAAAVPGAIAVACALAVREPPTETSRNSSAETAEHSASRAAKLPPRLRGYFAILLLFSLGNASDTFLLLRGRELGLDPASIPLLWTVLHVTKFASSWLGGELADRLPRTRVIAIGWIVYAVSYFALGIASEPWHVWAVFVTYGLYHGLSEPAEKALVRDLSSESAHGRAFGLFHFVVGIAAVPAGLLTGEIWDQAGARAALWFGAGIAAVSAVLLAFWAWGEKGPPH